jgi:alcohol dehydrogenase (cytochrome c)
VYAHPFIHVDSIKVDPTTGKMTPLKFAKPDEPVVACGHGTAGKEWVSMAYSPLTQFVYVPAIEMCGKFFALDLDYQKGRPYYGGGHERVPPASGHVTAIDLATGKAAWRYDTAWPMYAGVLATGGGVLFVGNPQGELEALDQKTGKKLWGFKTGSGIVTNPMSFAVDGRQYVAISSGWSIVPSKAIAGAKLLDTPGQKNVLGSTMLFVFALPEAQRVSDQGRPVPATPSQALLGQVPSR